MFLPHRVQTVWKTRPGREKEKKNQRRLRSSILDSWGNDDTIHSHWDIEKKTAERRRWLSLWIR